MNKRVLTILLSAFIVAAGCSYLVYRIVGRRILASQQPSTTRVIVAAADIKLGSVLRDVDLKTTEIAGSVPKGAIVDRRQVIGRGVISNIYQDEPILENRLAAAGAGGGLAATISPGMRACAVKVDDVVGVAGFVTPGMRVDVLISGNPPGSTKANEGTQVKTLLQNIEVLSAGTDIQKDDEGKAKPVQVVNLLVTPEQAEDLSLASNQTHIQLVLRNPLDTQIAEPPGTAIASLFADKNAAPPKPQPSAKPRVAPRSTEHVYLIQVFNGSKRSEEKFVSSEGK
jgi:pilus assembly protein CpaB